MTSEIHKMVYCSSLFSSAVGWWKAASCPSNPPTLQLRLSGRKSRARPQGPLLNPPNEIRTSTSVQSKRFSQSNGDATLPRHGGRFYQQLSSTRSCSQPARGDSPIKLRALGLALGLLLTLVPASMGKHCLSFLRRSQETTMAVCHILRAR